uniref:Uncharacterized protein n=1 Tax=Magallana gigas TaxID=29159 RepID=K1RW35_MAGGI
MRSGDVPRASAIQSAKSSLEAKKIGNLVTPSPLFAAEQVSLMTEIIEAKAVQVPVFADTLKAAKKSTVFAESTYDNFWASGLDVIGTSHTNAKHWPGRNTLGKILADMTARLRARSPSVRSASASRSKGKESGRDTNISQRVEGRYRWNKGKGLIKNKKHYGERHRSARRRFHVLHGEIRLSLDKACQVVVACCIFHNICKDRQIPCPMDDGDLDDNQQDDGDGLNVQIGQNVNDGIRGCPAGPNSHRAQLLRYLAPCSSCQKLRKD